MGTSYKFTLVLALAVLVAAVMASGPPAEADPGYGNDFAPAVAGVIPGGLYEPAPFGAPVVGPTLPPPAPALPAGLVPAGVDMDDISYGNDFGFVPVGSGLFVDFSTGPGAVGDIAAPFPPLPSLDVYAENVLGDTDDESDIYSNWPAPFTGPTGCTLAGNAQQLDGDGAPVAPYAPRFGLNMPEPASNLDSYELSDETFVGGPGLPAIPVFFTIDAATPWPVGMPIPMAGIFGGAFVVPGPADVLAWDPGLPGVVVWAPAPVLGLGPGDDIDALAVDYGFAVPPGPGGFGVGPPGTDTLWYSLAPGSAALPGMPLSAGCPAAAGTAGDVWFHVGAGAAATAPMAFFMAENIGLTTIRSGDPGNDDIDAMDFCVDILGGGTNSDSTRLGTDGPDADLLPDDRTNPHEDGRTAISAAAPRGNACDYDNDNDWLSDSREAMLGTSPILTDTDGDVFTDWVEVEQGSDPLMAASRMCTTSVAFCTDLDGDGVPDGIEALVGSSTAMVDSDGDLLRDKIEIMHRSTNPMDPNTDNNTDASGCSDRFEVIAISSDGLVDFADLLRFAASYNALGPGYGGPTATWDANKDYNGSGDVGFADLLMLAALYNMDCGLTDLAP